MNRFINALLLFLLFPTMGISIIVAFDLPMEFIGSSGAQLPFSKVIFIVLGLLFMLIVIRRSIRRWMGMKLLSQHTKFVWNAPVSKERLQRIWVYNTIEALVNACVGLALFTLTPLAWLPALAFMLVAIDNFIFSLIGTKSNGFRVGITSKAVIAADREVTLMYYDSLRRVSIHQGSIFFDYVKGLQLHFPLDCLDDKDRDAFFEALEKQLDSSKVFVTRLRD
jgi:hypothetical protein